MLSRASPEPSGPGRGRVVLFCFILLLFSFLSLEMALRVAFALKVGPSVLAYGTRQHHREISGDASVGTMKHHESYMKFHPHQLRFTRDRETGELHRIRINQAGFRGEEFPDHKDPGVIRVVTLGASSTFGFSDQDDETYPHYLQQELRERCAGDRRYEVFNLGIPHLKSDQILALFLTEALPLDPDLVTFYEGINDSWSSSIVGVKKERRRDEIRRQVSQVAPLRRAFRWTRLHLVSVALVDALWKRRLTHFSEEDLRRHLAGKSERFLSHVAEIRRECQKRGILFIVATQQAKSFLIPRESIAGVSYRQEADLVRRKLRERGEITDRELYFLTHSHLMEDLEQWARVEGVPVVDGIEALDPRRDVLVSWVHLNAEGNQMLARVFADAILERTCTRSSDVTVHARLQ